MAQIFRAKKAAKPSKQIELNIESMDHQGRGVARHEGKVCFVAGALTGDDPWGQQPASGRPKHPGHPASTHDWLSCLKQMFTSSVSR